MQARIRIDEKRPSARNEARNQLWHSPGTLKSWPLWPVSDNSRQHRLPSRQRLSGLSYSTVEKVTRNLYRATIPGANIHRGANHLHSQSKRAKPAERVHSLSPWRLLCAGRVKSALHWKPGYLQVNWILLQVCRRSETGRRPIAAIAAGQA